MKVCTSRDPESRPSFPAIASLMGEDAPVVVKLPLVMSPPAVERPRGRHSLFTSSRVHTVDVDALLQGGTASGVAMLPQAGPPAFPRSISATNVFADHRRDLSISTPATSSGGGSSTPTRTLPPLRLHSPSFRSPSVLLHSPSVLLHSPPLHSSPIAEEADDNLPAASVV